MIPKKYPLTLQPVIPTYNFSDVDEGTGIITYYAFTSEKNSGEQYGLTTSQPFSHLVSISGSVGSTSALSGSFLTGAMNRPRILKGTAIFNMTWRVTNSVGSNSNYPFVSLDRFDGASYTNIGFVSGSAIDSAGGAIVTTALQITGITPTLIKIGEQIRVSYGVWATTAGSSPVAHIACDPQNRDNDWFTTGNFDTTKAIANIPFQITSIA